MRISPARIVFSRLVLLPAAEPPVDEARALLDRAIEAHGGEARIAQTKRGRITVKMEGDFPAIGNVQATCETVFDLPRRYRQTMEGIGGGQTFHDESAIDGTKGWFRQGEGTPRDTSVPQMLPAEAHWHALLSRLVLLRDKHIHLTALGEEQHNGRTLVGLHAVSAQGSGDVFFDKATGFVARARRPLPNPLGGREVIEETSYDDYRTVKGVRYPMHIRSTDEAGHRKDTHIISIEFLDKIEESAFAKPASPAVPEEPKPDDNSNAAAPARTDTRLIAATLGGGIAVGAVWLLIRYSQRRKGEAPAP